MQKHAITTFGGPSSTASTAPLASPYCWNVQLIPGDGASRLRSTQRVNCQRIERRRSTWDQWSCPASHTGPWGALGGGWGGCSGEGPKRCCKTQGRQFMEGGKESVLGMLLVQTSGTSLSFAERKWKKSMNMIVQIILIQVANDLWFSDLQLKLWWSQGHLEEPSDWRFVFLCLAKPCDNWYWLLLLLHPSRDQAAWG